MMGFVPLSDLRINVILSIRNDVALQVFVRWDLILHNLTGYARKEGFAEFLSFQYFRSEKGVPSVSVIRRIKVHAPSSLQAFTRILFLPCLSVTGIT